MSKGSHSFWEKNKRLLMTHLISLGVLLLSFVLCRYAFFHLHGMKEWPVDLLIAGLVVLLLSLFAKKKYVPWFTSIGYLLGFWLGIIFHSEGFDPGGGRTDNLWIIWTAVLFLCILAGILYEIWIKWRKLLKK